MNALRGRASLGPRKIRQYRGRQVCADTDHHERAIEHLLRYARPGARVADVGCGQGAFAMRMVDAGFSVVGIDVVPSAQQSADAFTYQELDLFDPAARIRFLDEFGATFDVVVLIEVIEHVHDPWETLMFARSLLRPDGVLLLSTPNITSFYSRFRFLTRGRFHQFEPADLEYGHINPMTAFMVQTVLNDTGFELIEKAPGPPVPILVWDTGIPSIGRRLFHATAWLVAVMLIPLMRGGDRDGWSLFFVARATKSLTG